MASSSMFTNPPVKVTAPTGMGKQTTQSSVDMTKASVTQSQVWNATQKF